MTHFATPEFWEAFDRLPDSIQTAAKKNFALLKIDPRHSSLQFKKVGRFRSARASPGFRALAVEIEGGFLWFWVGSHDEYERLIIG